MVEAIMMLMGVIKINEQVNFQLSVASVQLLSLIISAQSSTNRTHLISINKMNNSISILIRIKQFIFPLKRKPIVSSAFGNMVGLGIVIVTIQRLRWHLAARSTELSALGSVKPAQSSQTAMAMANEALLMTSEKKWHKEAIV